MGTYERNVFHETNNRLCTFQAKEVEVKTDLHVLSVRDLT
jgi:hypothetical protein